MKVFKIIVAIMIGFAAIKTNVSMLSENSDSSVFLGVLTADLIFGIIIYFLLRNPKPS